MPPSGKYKLRIGKGGHLGPNKNDDNKITYIGGHFDGHGGVLVLEEVHGYLGCHWMQPLGKYCGSYHHLDTCAFFVCVFYIVNLLKKNLRWLQDPI